MLTTNLRTTQDLQSVPAPAGVTAPTYLHPCTRPSATTGGFAAGTASFDASWSFIVRKPMPKVSLHPDRWPLHSTS